MKKIITILFAAFLSAALFGCDSSTSNSEDAGTQGADANREVVHEEITLQHNLGEVTLTTNPERVVVMDYGFIDILDNVGIGKDVIVGMPKNAVPDYLSHYESDEYVDLGNLVEADFEAISSLNPDLIIIPSRFTDSYDEFSSIAPTLFMPMPGAEYLDTLQSNLNTLAQVFPAYADEFSSHVDDLTARIDAIAEEADGKTALLIQVNDDALNVFGLGSRYGAIYTAFGFQVTDESIVASTHGQSASFEYVAQQDPDYLFVIDRSAAIAVEGATGAQVLLDNDLVNGMRAAQNDKIFYLNSQNWYMVAGGITSTNAMIDEIENALDMQ